MRFKKNWPSFSSSLNRLLEGRQIGIKPNPGSGSRGLSNLTRAMSLICAVLLSLKSGLYPLWTTTCLTPLPNNRSSKMLTSNAATLLCNDRMFLTGPTHFQYRKENWLLGKVSRKKVALLLVIIQIMGGGLPNFFVTLHFWSIKGDCFPQSANDLNFKQRSMRLNCNLYDLLMKGRVKSYFVNA